MAPMEGITEDLEGILRKLEAGTDLSRGELEARIEEKQKSLSDLLTMEGAAILVAKDLGIEIVQEVQELQDESGNASGNANGNASPRRLEIKNIVAGMKKVNAIGRVFRISPIAEFNKKSGEPGKVCNVFVGDSTGFFRMPLWNEQTKLVKDEEIKVGDVLQVVGAYASENMYGDIELSTGKYGSVQPVDDVDILTELSLPGLDELGRMFMAPKHEKATIKGIIDNEEAGNFKIKGTIVDVANSNFVFYPSDNSASSAGDTGSKPEAVISCMLDDETGVMRAVFFRSAAEELCGVGAKALAEMDPEKKYKAVCENLIGREIITTGRVQESRYSGDIELIVDGFKDLNIKEESEKLFGKLKTKVGQAMG